MGLDSWPEIGSASIRARPSIALWAHKKGCSRCRPPGRFGTHGATGTLNCWAQSDNVAGAAEVGQETVLTLRGECSGPWRDGSYAVAEEGPR